MPKKKKSGMQLFCAFLYNLYVEVCLHNEKYACILCSFVFKRFRAGTLKDILGTRNLRRTPLLTQIGGGMEEGYDMIKSEWFPFL